MNVHGPRFNAPYRDASLISVAHCLTDSQSKILPPIMGAKVGRSTAPKSYEALIGPNKYNPTATGCVKFHIAPVLRPLPIFCALRRTFAPVKSLGAV